MLLSQHRLTNANQGIRSLVQDPSQSSLIVNFERVEQPEEESNKLEETLASGPLVRIFLVLRLPASTHIIQNIITIIIIITISIIIKIIV